jgi:hypothetical protein
MMKKYNLDVIGHYSDESPKCRATHVFYYIISIDRKYLVL